MLTFILCVIILSTNRDKEMSNNVNLAGGDSSSVQEERSLQMLPQNIRAAGEVQEKVVESHAHHGDDLDDKLQQMDEVVDVSENGTVVDDTDWIFDNDTLQVQTSYFRTKDPTIILEDPVYKLSKPNN